MTSKCNSSWVLWSNWHHILMTSYPYDKNSWCYSSLVTKKTPCKQFKLNDIVYGIHDTISEN